MTAPPSKVPTTARDALSKCLDEAPRAQAAYEALRTRALAGDTTVTADALMKAEMASEALRLQRPELERAAEEELIAEQTARLNARFDDYAVRRAQAIVKYSTALGTARTALHEAVRTSHTLEMLCDEVLHDCQNLPEDSAARPRVHSIGAYAEPVIDAVRYEKPTVIEDTIAALLSSFGDTSTSAYRAALMALGPIANNARPIR